jgi:hypothetical protein
MKINDKGGQTRILINMHTFSSRRQRKPISLSKTRTRSLSLPEILSSLRRPRTYEEIEPLCYAPEEEQVVNLADP